MIIEGGGGGGQFRRRARGRIILPRGSQVADPAMRASTAKPLVKMFNYVIKKIAGLRRVKNTWQPVETESPQNVE